ncbi:VTT domain-containing protein [Paenibacillus sp. T3-5-0-4]|nr:VTT domain-containing protein [Paenibacillus endoradicis]
MSTLLASIPGIPFGIVSAVMGAKYGIFLGTFISVLASTISSVIIYTLFRYLLLQQGNKLLNKYRSIAQFDRIIKNHTFGMIFVARILPVMPAFVVNIYSGVFGLLFKSFFWATMIGKIPVMTVYTLIGDNMLSGSRDWIIISAIYILFIIIIYFAYRYFLNRRAVKLE